MVHAHSGLRWIALILILLAIINAAKSQSTGRYEKKDKMLNLFAMVSLHIQLVLGAILLVSSGKIHYSEGWMKVAMYRFYGLEHILLMIAAIAVITIGRSKAEKKLKGTRDKHRKILVNYTIGLLLILAAIPWPFREALGGGWF